MLNLITATPGSGKTLFVVSTLSAITDRPIYYHGIPELTLNWTELQDPSNWPSEVPDGCIVVLDEVQKVFPVRDFKKEKPLGVEALETHRHRGIDLYFITQHPSMLDVHVRRLVGTHIHLSRKFGSNSAVKYTGNECFDPKNYHELKVTEKTLFKFPKKAFNLYKSAETHTHKRHIPKFLYFIPLGLIVAGYFMYSFTNRLTNNSIEENLQTEESSNIFPAIASNISNNKTKPIELKDFKEKIHGLPGSAPVYAELWKPVTIPKLSCISSVTRCQCYTEQGTRYFISDQLCRKRIEFGVYDFTKPSLNNNLANNNQQNNDNKKTSSSLDAPHHISIVLD